MEELPNKLRKEQIKRNRKENAGCLKSFVRGLGFVVAISVLVVLTLLIFRAAGAFLIIANPVEKSDAVIILGGGDEGRIKEAISIYNDGLARLIVLTETGVQVAEAGYTRSFDLRIQLLNNGVPDGNIIVSDLKASNTLEESRAVLRLMEARQLSTAIVVTDPYHTKRTSLIFGKTFEKSGRTLIYRPVSPSWYTSQTWFLSPSGWKFTISEYLKLAAFYFLGIEQ